MATTLILGAVRDYALGLTPTGTEANSNDLALANLTTRDPLDIWLPAVGTTARPFLGAELHVTSPSLDLGTTRSIGSVVLANLNASSSARARARVSATAIPAREKLPPVGSLFGTSNITGAVADIDEDPESIDANAVESTSDAGSAFTANMDDPSGNPATGVGLQIIRLVVTAPAEGAATIDSILIQEASVTKETCALSTSSVAAGKTVSVYGYWDAASLATADGTAAQVRLTFSDGQATDGDVRIEALDWWALVTEADYEGDWIDVIPSTMAGATLEDSGLEDGTLMLNWHDAINVTPGTYAALTSKRYLQVEIDDPANSDGYVSAGRLMVGPSIYSSKAARGFSSGIVPAELDHAIRTAEIPVVQISATTKAEILAHGVGFDRDRQFILHLLPDLATASRTPWHLPILVTPSGRWTLSELYAAGASAYSGSLSFKEYWGENR